MARRLSTQAILVLRCMIDSAGERYGSDIAAECGLKTGSLYPILARLEAVGWLSSRWEDINPHEAGRPARRYYRLTATGRAEAARVLSGGATHAPKVTRNTIATFTNRD